MIHISLPRSFHSPIAQSSMKSSERSFYFLVFALLVDVKFADRGLILEVVLRQLLQIRNGPTSHCPQSPLLFAVEYTATRNWPPIARSTGSVWPTLQPQARSGNLLLIGLRTRLIKCDELNPGCASLITLGNLLSTLPV